MPLSIKLYFNPHRSVSWVLVPCPKLPTPLWSESTLCSHFCPMSLKLIISYYFFFIFTLNSMLFNYITGWYKWYDCILIWLYLRTPHCALITEDGWRIISKTHQSTRFYIADHKSYIVSQCSWYLLPIFLDIYSCTRELFHTVSGLNLQHWISNIFRWQHISHFKEAMSALTRELEHSPDSAKFYHPCLLELLEMNSHLPGDGWGQPYSHIN